MNNSIPSRPPGFHHITPSIVVKDPDAAIKLYEQAFGAELRLCLRTPQGAVMHAEMKIGDSIFMMGGEWADFGVKAPLPNHCSSGLHLYVDDCDQAFQRAVSAGCRPLMPPANMFWGDRFAKVQDPFGHQWSVATHIEDVSDEECARRAATWQP